MSFEQRAGHQRVGVRESAGRQVRGERAAGEKVLRRESAGVEKRFVLFLFPLDKQWLVQPRKKPGKYKSLFVIMLDSALL